jgi:putative zinc finger/helix-turn-helix YgiT family protein
LTEFNGQKISLPLHYSVCDQCGAELTNASQSQANKRAMVAAEKETHGLLAGESIQSLRKQYKLSQVEAAQLFGGGKVGFSRYENDDIVQSQAMDSFLRLCVTHSHNLIKLAAVRQVSLQARTRQDLQADAHRQMIAIAPKVEKTLGKRHGQRPQKARRGSQQRFAARQMCHHRALGLEGRSMKPSPLTLLTLDFLRVHVQAIHEATQTVEQFDFDGAMLSWSIQHGQ